MAANRKEIAEITRYLVGDIPTLVNARLWNKNSSQSYPSISPLLRLHLQEVNRFLFSGGITFDVVGGLTDDPRQQYVQALLNHWKLDSNLESIWHSGAIYGDLGVVIKPQGDLFRLEWFDGSDVELTQDNGETTKVVIKSIRLVKNNHYVYRLDITPDAFIEYPLVPVSSKDNFNWTAAAKETPHKYGECPFVLIKNKSDIFSSRGIQEFDYTALNIAISHLMLTFDGIENVHFFGHPLLISPDPQDTIDKLKKRIQVLQKEAPEDGGAPEYLTAPSITQEQLSLLDRLEGYFRAYMGLSSAFRDMPSQISNVALHTLNAATISLAETRWLTYVDEGLIPLVEKCLRFSKLPIVSITDPSSYQITCSRKRPYFFESPQDRSQLITLAEAMVDLGVDRAQALQETVYPHLTIEQIREKLSPNLGDF